ncbi:hypothetical protein PsYK624_147150, partial [Phanerochaete sordida]
MLRDGRYTITCRANGFSVGRHRVEDRTQQPKQVMMLSPAGSLRGASSAPWPLLKFRHQTDRPDPDRRRRRRSARYPLLWPSEQAFNTWKCEEEKQKTIEFRRHKTEKARGSAEQFWLRRTTYVCARNLTGGKKAYTKKTERKLKIDTKKLSGGCTARLVIKTYPGTTAIRGKYTAEHSHDISDANLRFTRIPEETRERIAALLRQGVKPALVLAQIHGNAHQDHASSSSIWKKAWWRRAPRPVCTTQTAGHYPLVWTIQTRRHKVCTG